MKSNKEESAEYIKQEQNDIIKEKWIPFLSEYCECKFRNMTNKKDPKSGEYVIRTEEEQEEYNKTKNVYKEIFNNMKPIKSNEVNGLYSIEFNFKGSNEYAIFKNNSWGHLNYVCTEIKKRHQQENGYWRYFPNSVIAGYIFGFFSVISWVGMGYFAHALRSATTKGESKFNVFINSLAGIFDTAACGFILYSLIVGAPMFSIPMIIAAAVSVLLRVIFTVFIFNHIYENKKLIAKNVYRDQTLGEIEKYLEKYKPKEVPEPDKEVEEKPKEEKKITEKNKDEKEMSDDDELSKESC